MKWIVTHLQGEWRVIAVSRDQASVMLRRGCPYVFPTRRQAEAVRARLDSVDKASPLVR